MSTSTTGSVCSSCRYSRMFAWTVKIPSKTNERRSSPFSFKGHEVHLKLTKVRGYYKVELCTPPSFPTLSVDDMIVRVETKSKTPLDLPSIYGVEPDDKAFWFYSEDEILKKYPDFRKDGGILTFLIYNVDPPKEKFVQTPDQFNDVSSLEGLSSDQYEVPSLMRRCKRFLLENLTPENVCELLVLADAHGDQNFKEHAMDYVKNKIPLQEDHWLPFQGTYPTLSSEVLYRFLKRAHK